MLLLWLDSARFTFMLPFGLDSLTIDTFAMAIGVLAGIGGLFLGTQAAKTNPNSSFPGWCAIGCSVAGYYIAYTLIRLAFAVGVLFLIYRYWARIESSILRASSAYQRRVLQRQPGNYIDRLAELHEEHDDNRDRIVSLGLPDDVAEHVLEVETGAFANRVERLMDDENPQLLSS